MEIADLPNADDMLVAVDTEGSGLYVDDGARISVVSLAYDGGSAAFAFDHGYVTPLGPKVYPPKYPGPSLFDNLDINLGMEEWHALMRWLLRQQLVFHNAVHDLAVINAGLRNRPGSGYDLGSSYVWDTMVVAPLLWPNQRVGLDAIGIREFNAGKGDALDAITSWKKKYLGGAYSGRYDLIPDDLVIPYAIQDAEMTLRLFRTENELIDCGEVGWEAVEREIDLAIALYYAERNGVGFDVAACLREDGKLAEMEQRLLDKFKANGIEHPTEDTMRQFWFDKLGLTPPESTPDGKPAVTQSVVRTLVEKGVPGARTWQALTKVQTARSMWYSAWPAKCGPDGRLRTRFRQTKSESDLRGSSNDLRGARSGRLAVQRIQLQAIPHDYQIPEGIVPIRKMFKARPGNIVIELDVSQAEMRAVAGLSRCTGLLAGFAAGNDAHDTTCRLVFQIDKDHRDWDFKRNVSKRLNFGIVYGAGIPTLQAQIRIFTGYEAPEHEVRTWWEAAKRAMPEVFWLSRTMQRRTEQTNMVQLVGGKIRHFQIGEYAHKAMNALIQGSVAVAMADSMIAIDQEFGFDHLLLQIHDSVVLELPVDRAEGMRKRCQQIIEDTFEGHFNAPFRTDWKEWTAA